MTMWESVAEYFINDLNVIFDLFNEPYPDRAAFFSDAWGCLLNGGTC